MCVEKYIFASYQYSNREATNRGENELSARIMHPGKKEYLKIEIIEEYHPGSCTQLLILAGVVLVVLLH
jgi:hypothetical protein